MMEIDFCEGVGFNDDILISLVFFPTFIHLLFLFLVLVFFFVPVGFVKQEACIFFLVSFSVSCY